MTRPRRPRAAAPEISDTAWRLLTDAPLSDNEATSWEVFALRDALNADGPSLADLWAEFGPGITESWAEEHPGTRPSCWWSFSVPRPARLRLGGIGTPSGGELSYGVPLRWKGRFEVAYANGRAHDIYGEPISSAVRFTPLAWVALDDPDDPPVFESQAAYLVRLGQLLPGEHARLTPAAFEPEAMDARGYLEHEAAQREAARQERIRLGSWQGEPEGWDTVTGPFLARPAKVAPR